MCSEVIPNGAGWSLWVCSVGMCSDLTPDGAACGRRRVRGACWYIASWVGAARVRRPGQARQTIDRGVVSRRKRKPELEPVIARPPRWLLFGSLGLAVFLLGPPVAAFTSGGVGLGMVLLTAWPLVLVGLIWRSRLRVDGDGATFTFLGTRHVPWSDIDALVGIAPGTGLRGPHLRVRDARPLPLNPLWRVGDATLPEALAPWGATQTGANRG